MNAIFGEGGGDGVGDVTNCQTFLNKRIHRQIRPIEMLEKRFEGQAIAMRAAALAALEAEDSDVERGIVGRI